MKGKFIAFEGIDGSGKTTQINYLKEWLPKSGLMPKESNIIVTREPGGTPLGSALRELLLNHQKDKAPESITELLLYAADRAQHVSKVISPALKRGDWIISDRYSGSTIAYQGYGRLLDLKLIKELESIATQGVSPDITLWLNISVEESQLRRAEKKSDRIESEGNEFMQRVSSGFELLAKQRNWITIPGVLDVLEIKKIIEHQISIYLH